MSWSPELFIGELMPFPDTVHVVKGKTDEMKRYVPEGSEHSEYYAGYQLLMTRCAMLTNLLRDMFPLINKDLLDESDRDMLVSCNDRYLALVEGSE